MRMRTSIRRDWPHSRREDRRRAAAGSKEPAILDQTSELWRNSEILLTSSPTFANGTIYLVNKVGELCAIDPKTGAVNWRQNSALTSSMPRRSMLMASFTSRCATRAFT